MKTQSIDNEYILNFKCKYDKFDCEKRGKDNDTILKFYKDKESSKDDRDCKKDTKKNISCNISILNSDADIFDF